MYTLLKVLYGLLQCGHNLTLQNPGWLNSCTKTGLNVVKKFPELPEYWTWQWSCDDEDLTLGSGVSTTFDNHAKTRRQD